VCNPFTDPSPTGDKTIPDMAFWLWHDQAADLPMLRLTVPQALPATDFQEPFCGALAAHVCVPPAPRLSVDLTRPEAQVFCLIFE
jgi:hypothetical protein